MYSIFWLERERKQSTECSAPFYHFCCRDCCCIATATAASSGARKDEQMAKSDMAVASVATLVAAQCVEAAESMGAEREYLASLISSAVNVRSASDIMTLITAAATGIFCSIFNGDSGILNSILLIYNFSGNFCLLLIVLTWYKLLINV